MNKTVKSSQASLDIWLLHVELLDTAPSIWRRVAVPADLPLEDLHGVLQIVMGWEDCHLHQFRIDNQVYGMDEEEVESWRMPIKAESRYTLREALGRKKSFDYLYDFGDCWEHKIKVEKRGLSASEFPQIVYCLEGANACPPEDVGGLHGFYDVLEALENEQHPEYESIAEEFEGFDPALFDRADVNHELMQFQPPEAREVYQILKEVALGQRVMRLAEFQLESEQDDDLLGVEVDDWWIVLGIEPDGVARCVMCRAADGRVGSQEDWSRPGTDPVAFLSVWEKQQIDGLLEKLG